MTDAKAWHADRVRLEREVTRLGAELAASRDHIQALLREADADAARLAALEANSLAAADRVLVWAFANDGVQFVAVRIMWTGSKSHTPLPTIRFYSPPPPFHIPGNRLDRRQRPTCG